MEGKYRHVAHRKEAGLMKAQWRLQAKAGSTVGMAGSSAEEVQRCVVSVKKALLQQYSIEEKAMEGRRGE